MLIVIDGYNLIFAVSDLERYVKADNIETARDRLISLLVRYKTTNKYSIILVFDSNNDDVIGSSSRQEVSGLEILYAKYAKDADTQIKDIVARCQNPHDTFVVTNDNDIRTYVRKKGGNLIDSVSFYAEVTKSAGLNKRQLPREYKSKLNGPTARETRYWLDVFKDMKCEGDPRTDEAGGGRVKKDDDTTDESTSVADRQFRGAVSDEPIDKYLGSSTDDMDYWLKFFHSEQD